MRAGCNLMVVMLGVYIERVRGCERGEEKRREVKRRGLKCNVCKVM